MIVNGDSREVLAEMIERGETVHSIVTDPPYGLTSVVKRFGKADSAPAKSDGATGIYRRASVGFMGQEWDGTGIEQDPSFWRLCLDVLKPGGHLLAFGGTRTWHRIGVAIDDAGFEIRDSLMWLYGTGFPKSHNVALSIDKAVGHGNRGHRIAVASRYHPDGTLEPNGGNLPRYEAKTTEAAAWTGWGTALKPAWEPVIVARKPLIGTVAQNTLQHGVGALNIDGCRIETDENLNGGAYAKGASKRETMWGDAAGNSWRRGGAGEYQQPEGRWPANVLTDGSLPGEQWRYFYTTKASKRDRNSDWQGNPLPYPNPHPTVKPADLMRWLVTLVTPPGGVVLDPFAGSGSTGKAARAAGFRFIGIEADPKFADIAWMRYGGSDFEAKMAHLRWAIRENEEARNG